MIIDKRLQVSSQQALTATAGSTDVVDLGSARNVGPGEPLWLVMIARTAMTGTSPTLSVAVQTDDNSGFSSPASIVASQTFTALAAGQMVALAVPFANERYLRANYTLGGTSPAVTVDAFFTNQDPTAWTAQPDAI